MVVCKYFLNNCCRFGSRCRFEHVLDSPKQQPNPYVYIAKQPSGVSVMQRGGSFSPPTSPIPKYNNYQATPPPQLDDVSEYMQIMMKEAHEVEHEHVWTLSCLGILKGHGNIPEWVDYSPEELRWEAYRCQAEGNLTNYVMGAKTLLNKAKDLRSIFLRPTKVGESIIRNYLRQSHPQEAGSPHSVPESRPIIRSATDVFNSSLAPSGNFQQQSAFNTFSFASIPTFQGQQNTGSSNIFGNSTSAFNPPTHNLFGQVPLINQPNAFGGTFHENSFVQNPNSNTVFSPPPINKQPFFDLPFGRSVDRDESSEIDCKLYTKIDLLTKEELEQFQADTFTLGKIPVRPPPKEFCVN